MRGKNWPLFIVFDETGRPWLSTLCVNRKGAISLWLEQCCGTGAAAKWPHWKKAGYACEPVTLARS